MRHKERMWRGMPGDPKFAPGGRWTRRMRWFSPGKSSLQDIRVNFEDSTGSINQYYSNDEAGSAKAEEDWEDFRYERLTVEMLRSRPSPKQ